MVPLPGSPGASWAMYRHHLSTFWRNERMRVALSFFLFGLINNVLYVIILTAAGDLVGASIPKGVVLLADVMPSFLTKLVAPYFIHSIPYSFRIIIFTALSMSGMLLVALTPSYTSIRTLDSTSPGILSSVVPKLFGIVLASIASGGGELSFLGLTHYYGHIGLASWSSGTGAAGLVGAAWYALATTVLGMNGKSALLTSAFLPLVMVLSFFVILPRSTNWSNSEYKYVRRTVEDGDSAEVENQGLLDPNDAPTNTAPPAKQSSTLDTLIANLKRSRSLFFPFMLPLLLVYIAEYTINQGVAPVILFPLNTTPFKSLREFYPFYNFIYQVGVFISRSSTPFFRIHALYTPSLLQVLNLVILTTHALTNFIPSFWIVFVIIFWEGLLGGLVYVSTFAEILDTVPADEREFSLGATSVSDSGGVCIAGFIGMALEWFVPIGLRCLRLLPFVPEAEHPDIEVITQGKHEQSKLSGLSLEDKKLSRFAKIKNACSINDAMHEQQLAEEAKMSNHPTQGEDVPVFRRELTLANLELDLTDPTAPTVEPT